MKTEFLTDLQYNKIIGTRYIRLTSSFVYYSKILNKVVTIPTNFICDLESVPVISGSSKRCGVIHDYFCRRNSTPKVTKQQAADLYFEAQAYKDSTLKENILIKFYRFFARHTKTIITRIAWGYFHKYSVQSTLMEILF